MVMLEMTSFLISLTGAAIAFAPSSSSSSQKANPLRFNSIN